MSFLSIFTLFCIREKGQMEPVVLICYTTSSTGLQSISFRRYIGVHWSSSGHPMISERGPARASGFAITRSRRLDPCSRPQAHSCNLTTPAHRAKLKSQQPQRNFVSSRWRRDHPVYSVDKRGDRSRLQLPPTKRFALNWEVMRRPDTQPASLSK